MTLPAHGVGGCVLTNMILFNRHSRKVAAYILLSVRLHSSCTTLLRRREAHKSLVVLVAHPAVAIDEEGASEFGSSIEGHVVRPPSESE